MEFEYWEDVLNEGSDEDVSLRLQEKDDYVAPSSNYPVPDEDEMNAEWQNYNPYPNEYAAGQSNNPVSVKMKMMNGRITIRIQMNMRPGRVTILFLMKMKMRNGRIIIILQMKMVHHQSKRRRYLVNPCVLEMELELMGLFIEMTRFQLGIIDMPVIRRPQRTSSLDGPVMFIGC
ncbi:hypothetical protein SLA2020_389400 [Shorea laevis]